MFKDNEALKRVTLCYSSFSAIVMSLTTSFLILSDKYLLLGKVKIFPLFLAVIFFEIFKWFLYCILYKRHFYFKRQSMLHFIYKSVHWKNIVLSMLMMTLCCFVYYAIAVLFGAEIFNKQEETLMFSLLLTLLTVLPANLYFDSSHLGRFFLQMQPRNIFDSLLYSNSQYVLIGAWLGAFVIPLDWDRSWQDWPIPCSLGAMFGCSISNCIHCLTQTVLYLQEGNKKWK